MTIPSSFSNLCFGVVAWEEFGWGFVDVDVDVSIETVLTQLDVTPTKAVLWEYGFDWLDRLVTVKRAEAVDVVSLPASPLGPTALQRSYVFDESDNRTFFDDHVNDVTYYYKYKSLDQEIPLYTQEELRPSILTYISQNFSQVVEDIEELIEGDIETYTGQTLQELELLAQENLENFVSLLEQITGQSIGEIYGDDFQEYDIVTHWSDEIQEIQVYQTSAGHRNIEDFVSLETFLHDADGNMTQRNIVATGEEINFTWSEFDRLKRVESSANGRMQDARYNVDGLRERKLDKNGNSSVEYGVGISTAASGPGATNSAAPSITYISGHMIMGAEIDGEFVYHLGDALSTVRDVVDHTGTVVKSFEFDEYGNLLSSTGIGTTSPKTWIGGLSVNDDRADSGMFNMGHRNYAAGVLGRFISRDPIGHNGGLNLYGYSGANPSSFVDPSGLDYTVTTEPSNVAPTDSGTMFFFTLDGPLPAIVGGDVTFYKLRYRSRASSIGLCFQRIAGHKLLVSTPGNLLNSNVPLATDCAVIPPVKSRDVIKVESNYAYGNDLVTGRPLFQSSPPKQHGYFLYTEKRGQTFDPYKNWTQYRKRWDHIPDCDDLDFDKIIKSMCE